MQPLQLINAAAELRDDDPLTSWGLKAYCAKDCL